MYISGEGAASSPLWRTSPITPTIVLHGVGAIAVPGDPICTRRPTGSSFENSCRAIVWLMTTTDGAVVRRSR